jgi:hypothetical protein
MGTTEPEGEERREHFGSRLAQAAAEVLVKAGLQALIASGLLAAAFLGGLASGPPEHSYAPLWRLIRQRAHQLATLGRSPTDRELDDFTRLVEELPAPTAIRSMR